MVSSNVKDLLVEKTADILSQPEEVVEKVVSFQFRNASQAAHLYSEIEISGFGKFQVSQPKVRRRIEQLEKLRPFMVEKMEKLAEDEKPDYQKKIESVDTLLEFLQSRKK